MDKDKRIAVMVLCPSPDSITYIKVVAALMVKKTRMPREKKKQLLACQLTGFLTLDSVKSGTGTRDNYLMD